jgi:hypothetical protein
MPIPNLYVIGAARSGTTSLYNYLSTHPDIYVPQKKELDYFGVGDRGQVYGGPDAVNINNRITHTWEEYLGHFDEVRDEEYVVDASPWYLYSPDSALAIRNAAESAKIIVILRNPATRAFSHFSLMKKLGLEKAKSFEQALDLEQERMRDNWAFGWFYRDVGFYGRQLSRYYSLFDKDMIKVLMFEDLQDNPVKVMQSLYEFLGVSMKVESSYKTFNAVEISRYSAVQKILDADNQFKNILKKYINENSRRKIRDYLEMWNRVKPGIDHKTKNKLLRCYAKDIRETEMLLERRLSTWIK